MSITMGATFIEALTITRSLKKTIDEGGLENAELNEELESIYNYMRSQLWHAYPYRCEDYIDQDAEPINHPTTLFSEERIEANKVARAAHEAGRR